VLHVRLVLVSTRKTFITFACNIDDTIQLSLQHRAISPNAIHPVESKTIALHLAASFSRADVVALLLDQKEINDMARNAKGLTGKAVAITKEIRDLIQGELVLNASCHTFNLQIPRFTIFIPCIIRFSPSYLYSFTAHRVTAPESIDPPRVTEGVSLLDLSYVDDASGTTLLHEAARRKYLRLVELVVRAGADVFVCDRTGHSVADAAGKDDRVKVFLHQCSCATCHLGSHTDAIPSVINQDKTLMEAPRNRPRSKATQTNMPMSLVDTIRDGVF
jgi:ankyrin repeat protein